MERSEGFLYVLTLLPLLALPGSSRDAAREREVAALLAPSPSRIPQSRMRQPDADFMLESHHDLSLTLSILELAPSGSYFPAVSIHSSSSSNSGVFHLRQGVQRRLRLKISTSGRALDWKSVAAVNIGRVRSVEASTGRLVEGGSGPDHFLSLKLLPSTPPKFLPVSYPSVSDRLMVSTPSRS
jgi:hypothetical protein